MPFNINTGVYTPPAGAINATTGQVIQSAVWNSIHADLSAALTQIGEGGIPWPVCLTAYAHSIALNAIGDTTVTPILNTSVWQPRSVILYNQGTVATVSASIGIFTGAGATGVTVVPATAFTLTAFGSGLGALVNITPVSNVALTNGNIFFRVTGTAAAGGPISIYVQGQQLP